MGNTDSIPVISQAKSLTQYMSGDSAGALATQQHFVYNNTFPVISQIASAGYAIGGDPERALDLQKKFADDMNRVIDSIPVAGHIKGGVEYAFGNNEAGEKAMKAASHSTGVMIGGIGGFAVGGPFGAVAGGIAGGAATDGIITGSDKLAKGNNSHPYGYIAEGEDIADAMKGKKKISTEEGFDMALGPLADGLGGYAGARGIGKPLALDVLAEEEAAAAARKGFGKGGGSLIDNAIVKEKSGWIDNNIDQPANKWGLDKNALDNRANQLNPNHEPSGPGRPAGYKGTGTKADLDNHANQRNPNHPAYDSSRG